MLCDAIFPLYSAFFCFFSHAQTAMLLMKFHTHFPHSVRKSVELKIKRKKTTVTIEVILLYQFWKTLHPYIVSISWKQDYYHKRLHREA